MSEMISAKEAAKKWGLSERRVTGFCKTGKIPGAEKTGRSWAIPADAEKPADGRVKTGAFRQTAAKKADRLPPPVGVSDYRLASTEYYYIDKTLMIRDFLDERPMVSLFTRPRRFGKTMNMDMLELSSRKRKKIPPAISPARKFGLAAKSTEAIRGDIRSSTSPLRI